MLYGCRLWLYSLYTNKKLSRPSTQSCVLAVAPTMVRSAAPLRFMKWHNEIRKVYVLTSASEIYFLNRLTLLYISNSKNLKGIPDSTYSYYTVLPWEYLVNSQPTLCTACNSTNKHSKWMDSQKFYYSISFQYREIIYFLNTFVFKPCSLQPQHLPKFASRQQQCEALLPLILCIEILLIKIESEDGGAIKSGNFSQNFRKANNLESMLSEAYADDLTIIVKWDRIGLKRILTILKEFEAVSGLQINVTKHNSW